MNWGRTVKNYQRHEMNLQPRNLITFCYLFPRKIAKLQSRMFFLWLFLRDSNVCCAILSRLLILRQPAVGVNMFIAFTCLEQTRAARTHTEHRPCSMCCVCFSSEQTAVALFSLRRRGAHATRAQGCEESVCVRAMSDPIHSSPNQYCR